ncbi:hypothetical protein F4780DRAFT_730277 [Xylariomycetidae sp. FL0641]|nr:hypothetical protein F4780DRAFT_730277 [Xylariomycetidae sp. FL0641]
MQTSAASPAITHGLAGCDPLRPSARRSELLRSALIICSLLIAFRYCIPQQPEHSSCDENCRMCWPETMRETGLTGRHHGTYRQVLRLHCEADLPIAPDLERMQGNRTSAVFVTLGTLLRTLRSNLAGQVLVSVCRIFLRSSTPCPVPVTI